MIRLHAPGWSTEYALLIRLNTRIMVDAQICHLCTAGIAEGSILTIRPERRLGARSLGLLCITQREAVWCCSHRVTAGEIDIGFDHFGHGQVSEVTGEPGGSSRITRALWQCESR